MNISVLALLSVFVLIAIRKVGNFRFQIWQVMILGAGVVLVTGQVTTLDAFHAINFDVMFFCLECLSSDRR